jgi:hypothetical protein
MIRPLATEIGLFLLPFAVYAAFLLATRTGILSSTAWPVRRIASLVIVSLILVIGSLLVLVQFGRPPSDAIYVPAHTENGKLVPQSYR